MFRMNLQLFGGGGSKSGLGGGGRSKEYVFGLMRPDGTIEKRTFKGRTPESARKKAKRFAKKEQYKGVSKQYREVTPKAD